MKFTKTRMFLSLWGLVFQIGLVPSFAHDNVWVHPTISESAAKSSSGLPYFLAESFGYSSLTAPSLPFSDPKVSGSKDPLQWIKDGSTYEDVPWIRGNNHFYDPITTNGLTDGIDLGGDSSFVWATEKKISISLSIKHPTEHSYPWSKARAYQLNALTNSSGDARQTNLAGMLFYLGHIIHLNQDLAVPAHVRNDNHGVALDHGVLEQRSNWYEEFGRKTYVHELAGFPQQPRGWSWWQTNGFQILEDFWDRHLLANGASALNFDAIGQKPLGLAEFCSGNFISEDARYKEYHKSGKRHFYEFPSLQTGTDFPGKLMKYSTATNVSYLKNGKAINRAFVYKTGDGITVSNHSAMLYLGGKAGLTAKVALSINDRNVLRQYHEKLIPKAIEYSAGILDYFFRGTMSVSVIGSDTNSLQYTNWIVNTSGQDFKDGTFAIYQDDTNGVRNLIAQTNLDTLLPNNGILPDGGSVLMTMSPLTSATNKFLLVYQGTMGVGVADGSALDPEDASLAVAAKAFTTTNEQTKTYCYQPHLYELELEDGATISTNLQSDDFPFTLTTDHYEVIVNYASFDDKGTIGSIESSGPITSCTYAGEITNTIVPVGDVTVDGNRLSVPVTATDDPDCGLQIGLRTVTITWRAWVPQP